mgnify:CR=1 FL=1
MHRPDVEAGVFLLFQKKINWSVKQFDLQMLSRAIFILQKTYLFRGIKKENHKNQFIRERLTVAVYSSCCIMEIFAPIFQKKSVMLHYISLLPTMVVVIVHSGFKCIFLFSHDKTVVLLHVGSTSRA